MTPDVIGRYRILGMLGTGGFANVYLAEDPRLEANVAIKLLSAEMAADDAIRARFIEEARVMRRLAAPGLVTVHDIDEFEHRPYFVMEHCARGTLADRLDQLGRPLEPREGLGLIDALARCTQGIHGAGVVHRDLKPGNYLIRQTPTSTRTMLGALLHPDEELVVADFGLAKTVDPSATRLTIAGGTPGYSAPEQFRADPSVDARADVYALSAIVVAAVSGEQPQPVLAPDAQAFTPEALHRTGSLAPELSRGLALDRAYRHHDVSDWHRSLREAASGPTATAAAPSQPVAGFAPPTQPTAQPDPASWPAPHQPTRPEAPTDIQPTPDLPTRPDSPTPGPDGTPSKAGGRRWLVPVVAALAVLGLAGLAGGALVGGLINLPGPTLIGPTAGTVGQEAVFAVDTPDAYTWSVDGQEVAAGRIVALAPSEPGTYEITAASSFRATTIVYTVDAAAGPLAITGPGFAPIGEATLLSATEAGDGSAASWTIDGSEFIGETVELRPASPGTIEVQLRSETGETTTRTITAAALSEQISE